MSKATVVLRDRRPAEAGAQWWRMRSTRPNWSRWSQTIRRADGDEVDVARRSRRAHHAELSASQATEHTLARRWNRELDPTRNHAPCRFTAGGLRRTHGRAADQLTAMAGID
jgi:hypothetical protein